MLYKIYLKIMRRHNHKNQWFTVMALEISQAGNLVQFYIVSDLMMIE
jgi:hypothetical protein